MNWVDVVQLFIFNSIVSLLMGTTIVLGVSLTGFKNHLVYIFLFKRRILNIEVGTIR